MYTSSAHLANAHEDGVWAVAWSPNGQVVTGSCDELVQTYMIRGQDIEKKHQLRGHQLGVCSVSVSEGGLAASSALDSHIRLWDLESGAERGVIDAGPVEAWTVSLSPDGRLVASGSQGGNINLWVVEGGEKQHTFETGGKFAMSVAISPDGTKVACGAADGVVSVFDMESQSLLHTLSGHALTVRTLAFSKDSTHLTTGSDDARCLLWDLSSGREIAALEGHTSWVLGLACSPDDAHIVSCSSDHTVKVWDAHTRQCVQTFRDVHSDQVWGVAFDPQGGRFCTVSDDMSLRLYEQRGAAA